MGGFVTWIGIGITGLIAGWEAVAASNPELAAIMAAVGVTVLGVARKIEKVIKVLEENK